MNLQLKQARDGFNQFINADPQTFSVSILVDSSDPWSTPTTVYFKGRLCHEQSSVPSDQGTPVGMSTHLSKFISFPYDVTFLDSGQVVTDEDGLKWRLNGNPDPLRRFKGIYGYQVSVTEVIT
jgi:hypothetical protein